MGPGASRSSRSYRPRISIQSVASVEVGLVVHCGDRRLQLVGADRRTVERLGDDRDALVDHGAVPPAAILLVEGHERAGVVGAGGTPGLGEQHEGEQAGCLARGVVRGGVQLAGEADRLGREVDACERIARARRVALGEDQVEHLPQRREALVEFVGPRHPELLAARPDARLRPRDALGDRRLGQQQGAADLGGREAADGAQREGDLCGAAQRRVAAEQEQRQRVVDRRHRCGRRLEVDGVRFAAAPRDIRSHLVDVPTRRDPHEPGARTVGDALGRPLAGGGDEGLLHGVLARLEVAVAPNEHRERRRGGVSQCSNGGGGARRAGRAGRAGPAGHRQTSAPEVISSTGRTSMSPNSASGNRPAISMARASVSQSTR